MVVSMEINDLISMLESGIRDAEHKPGNWASSPNEMGGIVSRSDLNPLEIIQSLNVQSWAHFSYKRDSWLAVMAVNALPVLIEHIRKLENH